MSIWCLHQHRLVGFGKLERFLVIVRAESEEVAKSIATAGMSEKQHSVWTDWRQAALAGCEELKSDGKAEILTQNIG